MSNTSLNIESSKPGYKLTKAGWIPEDWNFDKSACAIKYFGGAAFKSVDQTETGIRCLKIANVGINKAKWKEESFLPNEFIDSHKRYLLVNGDIVMALTRPILDNKLKIAKLSEEDCPALLNQRVAKLIAKNGYELEFIYHIFQVPYFVHSMNVCMAGTDPPNIGNGDLESIKIPLPKPNEQKAIAQVLSTWDKAIEKLTNLIELKEQKKKGLMQALLTGKKRFPGFNEEWKEYSYKELLKEVKRPVKWDDDELYHLVSVRRRSGGLFERDSLYGHQILTKNLKTAKAGDFLISKMQILHGASAVVTEEFDDKKISGSYIAVRSRDEQLLDINFLDWYSKMPYFYHQTYISSYGVHIEKMTFNFKSFLKLGVKIPDLREQKRIVTTLDSAENEIKILNQKLDALKDQKKGLMQQLLTGKKRLKVEN